MLQNIDVTNFPVQHLSVSAIRTYLENRQAFKKRYILLEFDDFQPGPALLEWKIFHAIVEKFWNDFQNWFDNTKTLQDLCSLYNEEYTKEIEEKYKITPNTWQYKFYTDQIIKRFDSEWQFDKVDYWKTWSKEKSIKTIEQLVEFYFEEIDKFYDLKNTRVLSIEEKITTEIQDLEWNPLPIMLKWFTDLIIENDKWEIIIKDHKTVTSFNTHEDFIIDIWEDNVKELDLVYPVYEIQACEYWFLVRALYWKNPVAMEFDQIKKSKNREWGSQIYKYRVDFSPKMIKRFLEIYSRIVRELSWQPLIDESWILQFLPNPFQQFGWQDSWLDFAREVEWNSTTIEQILAKRNQKLDNELEALDL